MKRIEKTTQLATGMIIQTGTGFYKVNGWTHISFSGPRWNEASKSFEGWVTVPLPSPCHPAIEVPAEYFEA